MSNKEYVAKIENDAINELPQKNFEGEVVIINDSNMSEIIEELSKEPVIGFDTETRPAFKKGIKNKVALLQLANKEKAWIFQLHQCGFPDELKDILANPNILKIGVAIHDDIKTLQKLNHFEPDGFVELQTYVNAFGIEDCGLRKLVANILDFRISKSTRLSNWENETLEEKQIIYAATDPWVCWEIYEELNS